MSTSPPGKNVDAHWIWYCVGAPGPIWTVWRKENSLATNMIGLLTISAKLSKFYDEKWVQTLVAKPKRETRIEFKIILKWLSIMVEWFGLFFQMARNWDQWGRVFNLVMKILLHEKVDKFMKSFTEMNSWRNVLVRELRWVDNKASVKTGKEICSTKRNLKFAVQMPVDITKSTHHLNPSARRT